MSDIKRYMVLDEEGHYEFDIFVDENGDYEREYSLMYSNNPPWTETIRGTLALKLTDTGNGFIFNKLTKKIDYGEAAYVKILLNFASTFEKNKLTYVIVEQIPKIKF